ncbi:unnamed protein product [Effrenium voratum]|uniref:Uncharacterized protein n=1 Tax=Effrenium voratum TaxID=2562239 RepID=A0AA36IG81_9DINO|nr:unnamed protein product [Effrenium voratum]
MISKVLSGLGMILVANHFIACFWYGLGLLYLEEGSWLLLAGIEEADFGLGYVAAMHWSLTQFTPATNNISPVTPLERLFAVVVILIAMGVFSSFISSITSAVNTLRAVRMEQLKQESRIRQFFNERNLSAELFNKVQDVCRKRGLFEIRLKEHEVLLLNEIPDSLKSRLHEEIFLPLIVTADFLPHWCHYKDHRFLRKVCHLAMYESSAVSAQDVFSRGTEGKDVLIVQQGSLGYYVNAQESTTEFDPSGNKERWHIDEGTWLSTPALFANWTHRGRLNADSGTCYFAVLQGEIFCGLAAEYPGPLFQYLQIFGLLLISVIEAGTQ